MKQMETTIDEYEYWVNRLGYTQSRPTLVRAMTFLIGEAAMFARPTDDWFEKSPDDGEWLVNLNESGGDVIHTNTYNLKELTGWVADQLNKAADAAIQMRSRVDSAIEEDEWYEDEDMDGEPMKSTYLTTIFHAAPSGKYYTPWANSNVNLLEAGMDSLYQELVDEFMSEDYPDYYLTSGEGDPLDILLVHAPGPDDTDEMTTSDFTTEWLPEEVEDGTAR